MGLPERLWGERLDHRLPDAVVIDLRAVSALSAGRPEEVLGPQPRQGTGTFVLDTRRLERHRGRQRAAGNRHDLEESSRRIGQLQELPPQQASQAQYFASGTGMRQLPNEQREAGGLARDRLHRLLFAFVDQGGRELVGFGRGKLAQGQLAQVDRRLARGVRAAEKIDQRRGLLAPSRQQEQRGGRVGRPEEGGQEGGAVGVAPLDVVDEDHEQPAVGEPGQHLAQGLEGQATQVHGFQLGRFPPCGADLESPYEGEQTAECPQVARQDGRSLGGRQSPQHEAQGVDQAVERAEGDRLPFVAASLDESGLGPRTAQGIQEPLHQGGLADARGSVNDHRHRLARVDAGDGGPQGLELLGSTDEGSGMARRRHRRRDARLRAFTQPLEKSRPIGTGLWRAGEQVHAERAQIARRVEQQLVRRWRVEPLLEREELVDGGFDRRSSGEGLVGHRAHRVPVACG